MRRGEQVRASAEAAEEFLAGITWANDSAVTAWIDPLNPNIVLTEDESYEQEHDEPWPDERRPASPEAKIEPKAKTQVVALPLQLRVDVEGGLVQETYLTDFHGVEVDYQLDLQDADVEAGM